MTDKLEQLELECECFGHRVLFMKNEDGMLYVNIADKKRGRPKWIEVILWGDKIEQLRKFLPPSKG